MIERDIELADALGLTLAPVAALSLLECAHRWFLIGVALPNGFPPAFLLYGPFLWVIPTVAALYWLASRYGRAGALTVTSGLLLYIVCCHQFKGSQYWTGLIGLEDRSPLHFYLPIAIGALVGLAVGAFKKVTVPLAKVVAPVCGLALVWTWMDSQHDIGMYDIAPYTRHLALTTVALVAFAVSMVDRWRAE